MLKFSGSIPEKICYVRSRKIKFFLGSKWDENYQCISNVLDTIAIDATDNKGIKNASEYIKHLYAGATSTKKIIVNAPIKNIRFLSNFWAPNGNYKVLIDNHVVNFKDDVLIDVLLKEGVDPGGILKGEFIWGKVCGKIQLIKIGSELHNKVLNYENRKKLNKIKKADFKVGGIYQTKSGYTSIFLGYFNSVKYENILGLAFEPPNSQNHFNNKKIKKAMLFYEVWDEEKESIKNIKNYNEENYMDYFFRISPKTSHSFIEKIGDIEVPDNIINTCKAISLRYVKKQIMHYAKPKTFPQSSISYNLGPLAIKNLVKSHSLALNMCEYNVEPTNLFSINKYLPFI